MSAESDLRAAVDKLQVDALALERQFATLSRQIDEAEAASKLDEEATAILLAGMRKSLDDLLHAHRSLKTTLMHVIAAQDRYIDGEPGKPKKSGVA